MSRKGSQFERDVAVSLSEWWSGGLRQDIFWRTHGSGARATSRHKKGKRTRGQYGDLAATDSDGQHFIDVFTCSLKRGYGLASIADLIDKPKGAAKQQFEKWHEEIVACWKQSGSLSWMLITKRDRRETMCYMPEETCDAIRYYGSSQPRGVNIRFVSHRGMRYGVFAIPLETFIKEVSRRTIECLSRRG